MRDKKTEITVTDAAEKVEIYEPLEHLTEEVVTRANCRICQSAHRTEVERVYEDTSSYRAAYNKAKELLGTDCPSEPAVRNHIKVHFEVSQRNMKLKEYYEDLSKFHYERMQNEQRLERLMAQFEQQKDLLLSESSELKGLEKIKIIDMANKIAETILKTQKELTTLREASEPLEVVISKFKEALTFRLKNASSDEERQILKELWKDFKTIVEQIGYERE